MWKIVNVVIITFITIFLFSKWNKFEEIRYISNVTVQNKFGSTKTTIVFLKTLKCASSTVVNILYRFSETNGLTVALPSEMSTHFGSINSFFDQENVENLHLQPFDIFFFHTRLDKSKITEIMKPNPFFFTILRNPVDQFISYYNYIKKTEVVGIEKFLEAPNSFYDEDSDDTLRNPISFMFGFNSRQNYSKKNISEFVDKILNQFDLIMISDYFDMSLMIFKKYSHWDIEDLVSFTINSQKLDKTNKNLADKILEWNDVDYALYQSAVDRLWTEIKAMNKDKLNNDLSYLQFRRAELYKRCVHSESRDNSKLSGGAKTYKELSYGFVLSDYGRNNDLCKKLVMSDLGVRYSYG